MGKGTRAWGKVLGHASVCKGMQGVVWLYKSVRVKIFEGV